MTRTPVILLLLCALAAAAWLARPGSREKGRAADRAQPEADAADAVSPPSQTPPRCPTAGYLCADVDGRRRVTVRRWRSDTGILVVHVPRPSFETPAAAQRLQSAAAAGVRAWNGQPFPIRVDLRTPQGADFSIEWSRSLGERILGAARTRWTSEAGLTVTSIDLVTRNPLEPERVIDPERVRLTAAHEMGHALGLPHSDSNRDVMYPENTAGALSARDYRTMEDLYALPDGSHLGLPAGR